MVKTYTTELAGRPLVMEFGKYCGQANGSVIVRLGDTVVMVNATASDTPREGQDFFPLSVDFEEKMYSVGKIPGGFIKREGRPSEKATLTSRLIDRPLRPLFNKGMRNDVQVVATVLSVEQDVPPDIPRKLYRGEWTVQDHIDLHGLFVDEARDAVAAFIRTAMIRGHRCLRIVHGKGYNSEGGQSVLKEMVRRWLQQKSEVMAFVQAPPHDGDSGAVIVLLEQRRPRRS